MCLFAQILKDYILHSGGSSIFADLKKTNDLSPASRRTLVTHLVNFIIIHFGYCPKNEAKIAVAKAAIRIFKCLAVKDSVHGGIVRRTNYFLLNRF